MNILCTVLVFCVLSQYFVWEKGHIHGGNTFGTPYMQEEYLWQHKQISHDDESSLRHV